MNFAATITVSDVSNALTDSDFYVKLATYIFFYAIFVVIWRQTCKALSKFFAKANKKPSKLYYYCFIYSNPTLEIIIPIILIFIFAITVTASHNRKSPPPPKSSTEAMCNVKMKIIKRSVDEYNKDNQNQMHYLDLENLKQTYKPNTLSGYLPQIPLCPSSKGENTYSSVGDLTKMGFITCSIHGNMKSKKDSDTIENTSKYKTNKRKQNLKIK